MLAYLLLTSNISLLCHSIHLFFRWLHVNLLTWLHLSLHLSHRHLLAHWNTHLHRLTIAVKILWLWHHTWLLAHHTGLLAHHAWLLAHHTRLLAHHTWLLAHHTAIISHLPIGHVQPLFKLHRSHLSHVVCRIRSLPSFKLIIVIFVHNALAAEGVLQILALEPPYVSYYENAKSH